MELEKLLSSSWRIYDQRMTTKYQEGQRKTKYYGVSSSIIQLVFVRLIYPVFLRRTAKRCRSLKNLFIFAFSFFQFHRTTTTTTTTTVQTQEIKSKEEIDDDDDDGYYYYYYYYYSTNPENQE